MTDTHSLRVVRVGDTPTELALRADDYLSELQRELELVRLSRRSGRANGSDPADLLASISAILSGCASVRSAVRSDAEVAAQADAPTFDAVLHVSAVARPTADKLRSLISRAIELAERGVLLTVPPAEDIADFLCDWLRAVSSQLDARREPSPTGWGAGEQPRRGPRLLRLAVHEPPVKEQPPGNEPVLTGGSVRARLEPTLSASRRARDLLRRVEDSWGRQQQCEVAELPLSELVTNAVLHARTQIEVAVCLVDESLRVEVHDERPELDAPRSRDPSACTGRGLELVGAIADRWGVVRKPAGKAVWFEVDPADRLSVG